MVKQLFDMIKTDDYQRGYRMFGRTCKRCKKYYRTPHRKGTICPSCHKPRGGNQINGGTISKILLALKE